MINFLGRLFRHTKLALSCAGKSDPGKVRNKNEDSFTILAEHRLFIVADGMGGHNAGEIASSTTVKIIGDHFTSERLAAMHGNPLEIRHNLVRSFEKANTIVSTMAAEKVEWQGMGCTLVVAYIDDATLHLCHVGDARCYIVNEGSIRQLTSDHTTLVEMGQELSDTNESTAHLQNRHVVTRVIGYPFPEPPEYNTFQLRDGARLLICTDGLWSVVAEKTLTGVIADATTPADAVHHLVDLANQAGGPDNITGVAVFCGIS
jgi:PPM family protein phosphatase